MTINRRELITGTVLAGALFSSSSHACVSPAPKDRAGYQRAIDRVFSAWWSRDYDQFLQPFRHPEREEPLPGRPLFDAHYAEREVRFRGNLLFNGASAVVQIVTPQQPNHGRGICGGHANSDLFLVKFYPGLKLPVIRSIQFLEMDLLASDEWRQLPGAPDVKIEPYWQLIIEPEKA